MGPRGELNDVEDEAAWRRTAAIVSRWMGGEEGGRMPPAGTVSEGVNIGAWAAAQTLACRAGGLSAARRRGLEEIAGWEWGHRQCPWVPAALEAAIAGWEEDPDSPFTKR